MKGVVGPRVIRGCEPDDGPPLTLDQMDLQEGKLTPADFGDDDSAPEPAGVIWCRRCLGSGWVPSTRGPCVPGKCPDCSGTGSKPVETTKEPPESPEPVDEPPGRQKRSPIMDPSDPQAVWEDVQREMEANRKRLGI